jgi:hypothetical protein
VSRQERARGEKPLFWVASSLNDLLAFPEKVQKKIGAALAWRSLEGNIRVRSHGKVLDPLYSRLWRTFVAARIARFIPSRLVMPSTCSTPFRKITERNRTPRRDVELVAQRLKQAQQEYEVRHYQ